MGLTSGGDAAGTTGGFLLLYSFRRCPSAIRARLALLASGTVYVIREVKLSAKPAELLAVSPKATVPVLVLAEGSVLDQSLDIMRTVLARHDPAGWLERTDDDLIAANDGPFKHHLDRAKYPERHDSDPDTHRAACFELLRPLEERLSATRFLCGDALGLADAAIVPFARQFAAIDRGWFDARPLPKTRQWLDGLVNSALFDAAMVRLPLWRDGDSDTLFPGSVDLPDAPVCQVDASGRR